jgi:hypothetical protein
MNTLLVVADLAGFKAFKLDTEGNPLGNQTPRMDLLQQYSNAEAHLRLTDKVTDLAGRFPRRTGARTIGAMSDGERHNIELEARKRLIRDIAARVNALARQPEIDRCLLAASKEINNPLVQELEPGVRAKIVKNIPVDLMKFGQAEILRRF